MEFRSHRSFRSWLLTAGLVSLLLLGGLMASRQSETELLQLTVNQGRVLIEAVAQILKSELVAQDQRARQDGLERRRVSALLWDQLPRREGTRTASFIASQHDIATVGVLHFDSILTIIVGREQFTFPDMVISTALDLFGRPDTNFLTVDARDSIDRSEFYIERSNDAQDMLILEVAESERSQPSAMLTWAHQLEIDSTLLFVSWETSDERIISSSQYRSPDEHTVLMLDSVGRGDEILSHLIQSVNSNWLELYRPFSSTTYPRGVLRLALPLTGYYAALSRSNRQILFTTLLAVLVVLVGHTVLMLRSKRKEQEESLKSLRGLLGNVLDSLELGVVVIDQQDRVQLSNGWVRQQLGESIREGSDIRTLDSELVGLLTSPQDSSRNAIAMKDGRTRWLLATHVPLTVSGDTAGTLIFIHDQTQMQDAETRIRRQERVAELGELAAGVAHDIRNPLHTISLGLQQLATSPAQHTDEIISLMRSEVSRINQSIARFLSLTKEKSLQLQSINLRQVVEERVAAWLPRALEEQKQIVIQGERELKVSIDAGRLRDILDNLVRNAIEAVQSGSGLIQVNLHSTSLVWEIQIDDNGPGIEEKHREQLFSPGFTTKESGTGIGLTLVDKSVREMGGTLEIARSPLGGARFTIRFRIG